MENPLFSETSIWIAMGSLRGFGHRPTGPGDLGVRDRREAVHPFRGLVLGGHLRRSGFLMDFFLLDKKKWFKRFEERWWYVFFCCS